VIGLWFSGSTLFSVTFSITRREFAGNLFKMNPPRSSEKSATFSAITMTKTELWRSENPGQKSLFTTLGLRVTIPA
jgi:hypothetical protein